MKENTSSGKMRACTYCRQFYRNPCDGKEECQNRIFKDTGHVNFGFTPVKEKPPTARPKAKVKIISDFDLF